MARFEALNACSDRPPPPPLAQNALLSTSVCGGGRLVPARTVPKLVIPSRSFGIACAAWFAPALPNLTPPQVAAIAVVFLILGVEGVYCGVLGGGCVKFLTLGMQTEQTANVWGLYAIMLGCKVGTWVLAANYDRRHASPEEVALLRRAAVRRRLEEIWARYESYLSSVLGLSLVFLVISAMRHSHTVNEGGIWHDQA